MYQIQNTIMLLSMLNELNKIGHKLDLTQDGTWKLTGTDQNGERVSSYGFAGVENKLMKLMRKEISKHVSLRVDNYRHY